MKKFKNFLLSFMLIFVMVIPFALVGCTRYYTVKVNITEGVGHGDIKITATGKTLVGEHDVAEGSTFEYRVIPYAHYEIKYVKVDGVDIYNVEWDNNTYSVNNADRAIWPIIPNVTNDHNVEVAFQPVTYTICYYALEQGEYVPVTNNDGSVYYTEIVYGQYVPAELVNLVVVNRETPFNVITFTETSVIAKDYKVNVLDKTVEQVKELLGIND